MHLLLGKWCKSFSWTYNSVRLDGSYILPEASCRSCAKITSNFERIVTRTNYGLYRITKDYSSRKKKNRPKTLTAHIIDEQENKEKQIHLQATETPNIYFSWDLPPPGILCDSEPSNMIQESRLSIKASDPEVIKQFFNFKIMQ